MKHLLATLIFASVTLSFAQEATPDRAALGRQMDSLSAKDWRPGVAFGEKLAALPSPVGYEILRDHWAKGASLEARQQMFKGFVFNAHPDTVRVLHLGATDPEMALQSWAFVYLKDIAFIDFAENYGAYKVWYAKYRSMPLKQVIRENATRLVADARQANAQDRASMLKVLASASPKFDALAIPGALELATELLRSESATQDEARAAQVLVAMTTPTEAFYRQTVIPAARSQNPSLSSTAYGLLGRAPGAWVTDELLTLLKEAAAKPGGIERVGFNIGSALGERKDPRAIPIVIGVIESHNAYDSIYGLGYFALSPLTGVSYDGAHDGAWWRKWWLENRERLPAGIRDMEIPTIKTGAKSDSKTTVPR